MRYYVDFFIGKRFTVSLVSLGGPQVEELPPNDSAIPVLEGLRRGDWRWAYLLQLW